MTHYLISFPSGAMDATPDELPAVGEAAMAVVHAAREAGVLVFAGGIDETTPPVRVAGDGTITDDTYPQTAQLEGGYTILDLPTREAAHEWATRIATACRCAQEVRVFGEGSESR
ncbi:YciI family protein [Phycicoccus duodecadis]|uniref:YCII-related domain-containing protein n=1 Tax=Phycicoccus duodecadis TaxID=173053 RepID=A0A2N3YMK5_9MICO|nr:YciI family protein [Phycicoccus duodecadis]PKW28083.1 hypothetical protein ATL31_2938 [Phycicoccus duodecadis]